MTRKQFKVGQKFNRLTAVALLPRGRAIFACVCGTHLNSRRCHVVGGKTQSCGCLQMENRTKHNDWGSRTYWSWAMMIQRCTNPRASGYAEWYGGRGVTVCDRWLNDYAAFLADMGERPAGTELDRYPNNNGNYEPGNVRWATEAEQAANRRNRGYNGNNPERLTSPVTADPMGTI